MKAILIKRSDIKIVDGEIVLKRKYGKNFQREIHHVDTNTKEGQEFLSS